MTEQRLLNNRYLLGELIGRGGMADVYKGLDQLLSRPVAVKMLRADLARDPQFQTRFRREAKSSASLNHPSIVAVYDTGAESIQDNQYNKVEIPFIVMEYLEGVTLRDVLNEKGKLDEEQAVFYTCGVLEALSYAHEQSIVHRDIKPSNVMVCTNGDIKVMDFGIARALADSGATMTQTSTVVGTAQYLSPEQARGEDVDIRSDLYSAGCLIFELLTGRPPFVGDSPVSLVYQHAREESPAPSSFNPAITPAMDAVVAKAMAKERDERFQNADEFAQALIDAHNGLYPVPAAYEEATQPISAVAAPAPFDDYPVTPDDDNDYHDQALVPVSETEPVKKKASAGKVTGIIMLIIALVIGAGYGGYYLLNYLEEQREAAARYDVPEVAGRTLTEAQNILLDAGFRPTVVEVFDDEQESGLAVGTEPAAGNRIPLDSDVELRISKGPEQVVIPEELAGQSEATVRDRLNQLGLMVDEVSQEDSVTVPRDRLISTNPALGSTVKVGDGVDLVLSTGKVTVPSVVGDSVEDARSRLTGQDYGFEVEVRYQETDEYAPGTVISQDVLDGTSADQGSTITLTVAEELPEPEPTETPEPTEEESDEPSERPSPPRGRDNNRGNGN